MTEKAMHQQPELFDGSQHSALIDQSPEASDALADLVNKCLYTEELVVVQLQTHANLDMYQDYFIDSLDDSFDIVTVNAHLLMSTEELFGEIMEQAGLDADLETIQGDQDKLGFILGQAVEELKADSAELVLQVNYAHELSSGVLNNLIALIENLRSQGAFHAVLWMDLDSAMAFENRISSLELDFSTIEILRFTAVEINEYLKFVFDSHDQPFAFNRESVKQIIVGSGGEAGKIDRLAREALERNPGRSGRKKDEYLLLKSMVAVAAAALVIIFLLPDDESADTDDMSVQGETERVVISINQQNQDQPETDEDETVFTPPVVADLPDVDVQAEQLATEAEAVADGALDTLNETGQELLTGPDASQDEAVEPEPVLNVADNGIYEPDSVAEDVPESVQAEGALVEVVDAQPVMPVPAPAEVELTPYEQQLQEMLSSADNEAFIQLLGTYNEEVALGFIEDNEIDDSFYYARTDLNGRDWFVVLYGSFVSERAAINALGTLPDNLQEGGPWVRNMGNIRATIKQ